MITSALNSALQGLQASGKAFQESAHRISRLGSGQDQGSVPAAGPEGDMVGLLTSRHGYEANLQVVRVADEMLGTLIDTLA